MYYRISKKLKNSNLAIVVILTTIINIIIYGKMLLGSRIYMYVDIGSDTINTYYPSLYYLVNSIKNGTFDLFISNIALGNSIFSIITQMLDPFFIVLLLIPIKYLQYGILISSILKIYTISIFSFFIFKRYFKNKITQIVCPLIYTFSSYVVLWGQHHTFLKAMMLFTIFMYFLDEFLFDEKNNKFLFILVISFFACSSIYFFYATGIFSVIYMTFWLLKKKLKVKTFFLKAFQLLGMAIFGCCLSMVLILPWIESFLYSNRGEGSGLTLFKLFNIDFQHILATVGRFYSTNLLGNANQYYGELNFYEAPILFTTSLTIIAILFLLIVPRLRKSVMAVIIVSILALSIPITNFMFNFTIDSYRWTFIITYISIFALGNFLDIIDELVDKKNIRIVGLTLIIFLSITIFLIRSFVSKININSLIGLVIFVLLFYFTLILLKNGFRSKAKKILLFLVILELIINNYSLVNNRGVISKEDWNNNYYNNGTKEVIDYIKSIDNGMYRIQVDEVDVSLNDSLVYDYLGLNSYNSLNKFSYEDYIKAMNLETSVIVKKEGGGNHFEIDNMDYIINTLLGVKYIICDNDDYLPDYYSKINEIKGKNIYKNMLYLPFGYGYNSVYSKEEFFNSNGISKYDYLLNGFFYTDNKNSNDFNKYKQNDSKFIGEIIINKDNINDLNFMNLSASIYDDKIKIVPNTIDPNIVYEFKEVTTEQLLLTINMTSDEDTEVEVYYSNTNEFSQYNSQYKLLRKNNNEVSFILPKGIKYIRIDPSRDENELYIDNVTLYSIEELNYNEKIQELNENSLQNITYEDSNLTGTINNTNDNDIMLVIPFSFDNGIKAYVDEEPIEVINVNGGLIGLKIESGEHKIRLNLIPSTWNTGKYVTIFSICLYIITVIIYIIRNKNRGKK